MRVAIWYRLIPERVPHGGLWTAETVAYAYAIEDDAGTEILTYHWHPEARSQVIRPHVHLESASGVTRPRLLGAHLPTGHVTLAQFIRCLIEELGSEPRRADWSTALERAEPAG
jgi:hypothetical protein